MIKSKLWVSLTAGAVLALGLGSAALATELTDTNADQDPGAPAHATNATLPDKASSVAKAVLAALTAGTNPSTVASKDADNANAKTDTDEANDTDTDNDTDKGSTGTKPGFGCGDDNHTHTGPSGRPSATMPPGCTKSQ